MEKGYGTKILPEAIDWHYGGSWSHIFQKQTSDDLENTFKKTGDLLRRSICLNISLSMSKDNISEIAEIIKRFCSELKRN